MKVLIISGSYPRPDNEVCGTFVHSQAKALLALGIEVRVICPRPRFTSRSNVIKDLRKVLKSANTVNIDSIPVTYLPYWNVSFKLSVKMNINFLYYTLLNTIKQLRSFYDFDLIHAHILVPTGYVSMLVSHRIGVPFVATSHGSDVHTNPHIYSEIARYTKSTIMRSDQIIAVSQALSQQIEKLKKPNKQVRVVYNGVDINEFKIIEESHNLRRQFGLPEGGVGVCTVCRLVREKGLMELLTAFEEIAHRHSHIWLLIIGEGPLKSNLQHRIRKRGLANRVFLVGSKPHSELAYWLNASDIFVLASHNEGLPIVLFEAMACARPVVATRVGGVPEAVIDNISAFLVPPRQLAPLAEALRRLIENPELRRQMGKAGYEYVRKNFLWSQSTKPLADVYDKLIVTKRHET